MFDWDKLFSHYTIKIRTTKKNRYGKLESPRRYIRLDLPRENGKRNRKYFTFARVVWNCFNPDDLLTEEYDIHHIDGNTLNDCPENLKKEHRSKHRSDHNKRPKHRLPKWDYMKAIELRESGMMYKDIEEVLGIDRGVIRQYISL